MFGGPSMRVRPAPRAACFVLLLMGCAFVAPHAQQPVDQSQPPVTFRAEINYVEIDAVVTDQKGVPVPGLTLSDFDVFEDGKLQKVTAFGHVNMPVTRPAQPLYASSPIEPDVQTNESLD